MIHSFIHSCARANARLHCLKRLKRARLPTDRLAIWYSSVIRPVLEHYAVVWHHGLKKYQTEAIEATQRRAIRSIYPVTTSLCHTVWRCSMLSFRLFQIGETHFTANCLIHLIAFVICCHPLVTMKSRLGLEEQARILDPTTVLTATNLSSIMSS